jgi:hypothetical protein
MPRAPWIAAALIAAAVCAGPAPAQRGTGADSGVGRTQTAPELARLSGRIAAVHTGPCKLTTGKAVDGAHLTLAMADGRTINLHLGPQELMAPLLQRLASGQTLTAEAFRTPRMPEDAYVARRVTVDGQSYTLRDQALRPLWRGRGGDGARQPDGPAADAAPADEAGRCWWAQTP